MRHAKMARPCAAALLDTSADRFGTFLAFIILKLWTAPKTVLNETKKIGGLK